MCVFIILSRSLYMCVCVCSAYRGHCWPLAVSVCAGWRVWTCIFIICEFLSELQPEATVDPWPGIYDTIFPSLLLLLFFLLLAGLQSSLLIELAFTLPPTGLHCFYWHHLAAIGLLYILWLMVFCIVLYFGWFPLFSEGFHCRTGFLWLWLPSLGFCWLLAITDSVFFFYFSYAHIWK